MKMEKHLRRAHQRGDAFFRALVFIGVGIALVISVIAMLGVVLDNASTDAVVTQLSGWRNGLSTLYARANNVQAADMTAEISRTPIIPAGVRVSKNALFSEYGPILVYAREGGGFAVEYRALPERLCAKLIERRGVRGDAGHLHLNGKSLPMDLTDEEYVLLCQEANTMVWHVQ